jgi:ATP-dependent 26S proteasome regulatory subunit
MDGVNQDKKEHAIRIFTTNEPVDDFDPAFLRPGRIDCTFEFAKPTLRERRKLIEEFWAPEIVEHLSSQLEAVLEDTKDLTFAEIESIRSFLIMHKISQGKWDIGYALDAFHQRHEGKITNRKSFGFQSH